jgi:hypothetical protein
MDAASYASQSDPAMNPLFRRRWTDPPDPQNEKRRPGANQAAQVSNNLNLRNHKNIAGHDAIQAPVAA